MGGFSRSRLSNRVNVPEDKMTDVRTRSSAAETAPPVTKSIFPADAHALIYRAAPSVTMSARKRRSSWKLQFDRHLPLRIEPLMGWTEDGDPLAQVELSFASAEAAIAYARRQGLRYTILGGPHSAPAPPRRIASRRWPDQRARPRNAAVAHARGQLERLITSPSAAAHRMRQAAWSGDAGRTLCLCRIENGRLS